MLIPIHVLSLRLVHRLPAALQQVTPSVGVEVLPLLLLLQEYDSRR